MTNKVLYSDFISILTFYLLVSFTCALDISTFSINCNW